MVYSITQEDSESKGGGWFGEKESSGKGER